MRKQKQLTEQQIFEIFPSFVQLKADLEAQGCKVTITGKQTEQSDRPTIPAGQTAQKERQQ